MRVNTFQSVSVRKAGVVFGRDNKVTGLFCFLLFHVFCCLDVKCDTSGEKKEWEKIHSPFFKQKPADETLKERFKWDQTHQQYGRWHWWCRQTLQVNDRETQNTLWHVDYESNNKVIDPSELWETYLVLRCQTQTCPFLCRHRARPCKRHDLFWRTEKTQIIKIKATLCPFFTLN